MKSPKMLFYINSLGKGGAERVISQLANLFSVGGAECILVTSVTKAEEYELSDKVKRISLERAQGKESRLMRNLGWIKQLRKICKEERPDVLISFMQESNFRALIATLGLSTKTIVSVRNDPNRECAGIFGRFVGKFILPMADGCVFQTEDAKAWFPKRLQNKSKIIMNAVSESFFNVSRENASNVVTVGRLNEQKNHRMLINAFALIAEKHPNQNLLIYGEGDLRPHLEQMIETLHLKDRIKLMGNISNVPEILASAEVFVLSSDYEGMPNALLEALAVGVPSVSTDCPCGGPKMLIDHGKNGLLVPIGDERALADAMDKLLSDKEYALSMGIAAKESAKGYMPEKIFVEWKRYIERVDYER